MTSDILLTGPLAHPALCEVLELTGQPEDIDGRLFGGRCAGIESGGWPRFSPGGGRLKGLRIHHSNPKLDRYAAVMGLHPAGQIFGVQDSGDDPVEWESSGWGPELPAAIARLILEQPALMQAHQIRQRLPMLAVWAASRLRGSTGQISGGGIVPRRDGSDIRWHDMRQPYSGFFAAQEWRLSHRTHAGGFTPSFLREGFIVGDAVVVLPWDPVRNRVLVIEQFRLAPALRHDPQPWLLEAIAGRIDPGETPEVAAHREAEEEAGLRLTRLIPAIHNYPSPGAVAEYLYMYVAITDLPDGVAGTHGLDNENEDIKGHLLDRTELTRMTVAGQINNGPLAILALWLETQATRLKAGL